MVPQKAGAGGSMPPAPEWATAGTYWQGGERFALFDRTLALTGVVTEATSRTAPVLVTR